MRQDIASARVVMQSGVPFVQLPEYNMQYSTTKDTEKPINYVYYIERDNLLNDLINKLCK